ncbi:NAD-dependent epimerase/dehydratase family protein [Polynucleobacter sp. IMCC 30228]|nr:NAD-dependent epimerase/dehydratase family protein [Polynucleobacter sp. IMCC 30228]
MPSPAVGRILVTGATGFVGRRLLAVLTQTWPELEILAAVRSLPSKAILEGSNSASKVKYVALGDIGPNTEWPILLGVDAVIHLAARTHVMRESAPDPLAVYRHANTAATTNLAQQAAAAGVKRFIFLSSIKVNGEETLLGEAFSEASPPAPVDPYGISKLEAEEGLQKICSEHGSHMDFVIIRAPLIYGPRVKANFRKLMDLVATQSGTVLGNLIPLPLGGIHNQRSFLALDNLVDFIRLAIAHPKAANQLFLLADGTDFSTPALIQMIAKGMHRKPPLLFSLPTGLMLHLGSMLGMRAAVQRLVGSLQVNSTKARTLLNWQPPLKATDAIALSAQAFLAQRKKAVQST